MRQHEAPRPSAHPALRDNLAPTYHGVSIGYGDPADSTPSEWVMYIKNEGRISSECSATAAIRSLDESIAECMQRMCATVLASTCTPKAPVASRFESCVHRQIGRTEVQAQCCRSMPREMGAPVPGSAKYDGVSCPPPSWHGTYAVQFFPCFTHLTLSAAAAPTATSQP